MSNTFERLPTFAKPESYKIRLAPCLKTFNCVGFEEITVKITEPTNVLKFHAQDIEFKNLTVTLFNDKKFSNLTYETDKKWGTVTVSLPEEIAPQTLKLTIDFNYVINDVLHGFYRSSYKSKDGELKQMVSTQFESTYARMAFPCWDEPTYKSTFDIELEVEDGLTALSNTEVLDEQTTASGKKLYKYATTPVMSPYLVAFAIGEFEYIEGKTNDGIRVRVYTTEGKKNLGEFSLDVAIKAIEYYTDFFGIPYPISKYDLIAIPDFAMGAMENWGLVTYREVGVLADPAKSSIKQQTYIALVVGHETAHFWFGNLVTMKWWNDLWLKEGFASFMEYKFVDAMYPQYRVWLQYMGDVFRRGMTQDSLINSHKIEVEINNPNELEEIYDAITYDKSNSLIRQIHEYVGVEKFREGLRMYLKKFQYSNAVTTDLWQALSEASGEDINKLMSSWTQQVGYPLLIASETKQTDGTRKLHLKQQRFLADGSTDETIWRIPIIVSGAEGSLIEKKVLMTEREQEFVLEGIPDDEFIKLNSSTTGFFRVQYSDEMLKPILQAVSTRKLNALDRFGIASDLFALVEACKVPASTFLELFVASKDEEEFVVWNALLGGIAAVHNVLGRSEDKALIEKFDQFVCTSLEPIALNLGWEAKPKEDALKTMLRGMILGRLLRSGHSKTIETALAKFDDHFSNKVEVDPDLRNVIYGAAAKHTPSGINKLQQIFESCGFPETERSCVLSLGQVDNLEVLKQVYDYGFVKDKIRAQDLLTFFVGTATTSLGQDFYWNFFKTNLPAIIKRFGSVNSLLFQHCIRIACSSQCSSKFTDEYEAFCKQTFDAESLKTLDRTIRQAVESAKNNEKLLLSNVEDIRKYVESR